MIEKKNYQPLQELLKSEASIIASDKERKEMNFFTEGRLYELEFIAHLAWIFSRGSSQQDSKYNLDTFFTLIQFCVRGENRQKLIRFLDSHSMERIREAEHLIGREEEIFKKIKEKWLDLAEILKGLKILEIGAGEYGSFVKSLRDFGAKSIGFDIKVQEHRKDFVIQKEIPEDSKLLKQLLKEKIGEENVDVVIATFVVGVYSGFEERLKEMANNKNIPLKEITNQVKQNLIDLIKPGGLLILSPASGAIGDVDPFIDENKFKEIFRSRDEPDSIVFMRI